MTVIIDGGAGITFPDTVQQTNALTNTGGVPRYYAARAWVTFDGTTTPPTILSASNVASVTRVSTGVFRVIFSTNMPNANYAANITAMYSGSLVRFIGVAITDNIAAPSVSSFYFRTSLVDADGAGDPALYSPPRVSVVVFA